MVTPSDPRKAVQEKYRCFFLWSGVLMLMTSLLMAMRQFGLGVYFLLAYNHPLLFWTSALTAVLWEFVCVLSGCLFYLNCSANFDSVIKAARRMRIAWIVGDCLLGLFVVWDILAIVLVWNLHEVLPDGGLPAQLLVASWAGGLLVLVRSIVTILKLGSYVVDLERAKPEPINPPFAYGATADV